MDIFRIIYYFIRETVFETIRNPPPLAVYLAIALIIVLIIRDFLRTRQFKTLKTADERKSAVGQVSRSQNLRVIYDSDEAMDKIHMFPKSTARLWKSPFSWSIYDTKEDITIALKNFMIELGRARCDYCETENIGKIKEEPEIFYLIVLKTPPKNVVDLQIKLIEGWAMNGRIEIEYNHCLKCHNKLNPFIRETSFYGNLHEILQTISQRPLYKAE